MNEQGFIKTILLSLFLVSCAPANEINYSSDSIIDNFTLEQTIYPSNYKLKITSKNATIDNINDSVSANNVNIDILRGSIKLYNIVATKSEIDQSKNIIRLIDKIKFRHIIEKDSLLKANMIKYNTKNQVMTILGNINLNYKNSLILATKGQYFLQQNKLILTGVKDHKIYNENDKDKVNPVIVINATSSIINGNENKIYFQSESSKVKSKISLF